jgi:hypothetical protein
VTADYQDWGALAALQTFITDLNLASQTLQATAEQIAAEIAATGVPLLGNPAELYSQASLAVTAGASGQVIDNTASAALTAMGGYLSYDVAITPKNTGSATTPFVTMTLSWYGDAAGSVLIYQEMWTVPAASSGAYYVIGSGPVRGAYLQVTVTNEDATHGQQLAAFALYGNSRPAPEPEPAWFTVPSGSPAVTGYTLTDSGHTTDGMLLHYHGNLTAGSSVNLLGALYFGQQGLDVSVSGTSPSLSVSPQAYVSGKGLVDIWASFVVGTEADTSQQLIYTPRSPLVLNLVNNNASNGVTFTIAVVAAAL